MSIAPVLTMAGVSLVLGDVRLFDGIDLTVGAGERVGVVGDSGTGKSVLLRLASGLTDPLAGTITLFGESLVNAEPPQRRILRSRCGLGLQGGSLISGLTVEDNLWLALGAVSAARARLRRRLDRVMYEFGIDYAAAMRAGDLSQGERQRVELARAFLRNPELLVLDEPLEALRACGPDMETRLLRQITPRGRSLLLLTQDVALAERLCDRVLHLVRGRLVTLSG
ncbi:ABC transporter ATP-binding protein [Novosphingobium sp.]|uniref:ABC transporter ATP-binding protein n=1 Tax=Novosphingobium sp. TaxID=1874826 RepID=UPI00333EC9D2